MVIGFALGSVRTYGTAAGTLVERFAHSFDDEDFVVGAEGLEPPTFAL